MKRLYFVNDGDREVLRALPKAAKYAIGKELRRLQNGDVPLVYKPLKGFGAQVGELKRGRMRVVYTTECPKHIAVIVVLEKQGDSMRPEHGDLITKRLKALRASDVAKQTGSRMH